MYHHLHASQDGTILATSQSTVAPAVEGEALITAGLLSPADRAAGAELDESSVLQQLTTDLPAVDTLQTVRPNECPPCPPPQVVYRDRTITKQVPVPGPTQYVYLPGPSPAPVPYSPGAGSVAPGGASSFGPGTVFAFGDPASSQPGGGVAVSPEQEGVHAGPGFPWWLLAAAGLGFYWFTRKKR